MTELTIGRLAEAAGVSVETIRYYQRRGLIAEPARPHAGHRRYAGDALQRLRFIRRAQALGFTLEEIDGLLALDAARDCADTHERATQKLRLIEGKLVELGAMRDALTTLLRRCESGAAAGGCPIILALAGD